MLNARQLQVASAATTCQRRYFLSSLFGGASRNAKSNSSVTEDNNGAPKAATKMGWPFGGSGEGAEPIKSGSSSASNAARIAGEQLVDASLALLDHARATDKYNSTEIQHIDNLLQIVFVSDGTSGSSDAQTLGSLPEQFEAAANAYIAFIDNHPDTAKIALVVMESFVPSEVGNMFQFVDWGIFSVEERAKLILFTKAVLGGEDELAEAAKAISGSSDQASIAALAHHLQNEAVPKVEGYSSIMKFLGTAEEIHLNAQLVVLLGKLMQVFDPEGTGRVALHEIEDSLMRVAGEKEAERLLQGLRESAQVDKSGGDGTSAATGAPYITYATLLRMIQTSSHKQS